MRLLINVGLGLSVVFTCLLLALVAQIYYLPWWKRRTISREIIEDNHTNSSTKSCCKTQAFSPRVTMSSSSTQIHQEVNFHPQIQKEPLFEDQNGTQTSNILGEELIITMPPRFLFTIEEETKEDMESSLEDHGKIMTREGTRKSLSDLMKSMEVVTPYASPDIIRDRKSTLVISPTFLTPSNVENVCLGVSNPFNEYSNESEFNRIVKYSSPPPKFKFLRNAEEKLLRKTMLMEQVKRERELSSKSEGVKESFVTIIVAKNNKENDIKSHHHYHSPLCTSS